MDLNPLICDKDGKISKGNVMCWMSFIILMGMVIANLKGVYVTNDTFDVVKYIFTTTFLYRGWKKGADGLEKINITKNGIETK